MSWLALLLLPFDEFWLEFMPEVVEFSVDVLEVFPVRLAPVAELLIFDRLVLLPVKLED